MISFSYLHLLIIPFSFLVIIQLHKWYTCSTPVRAAHTLRTLFVLGSGGHTSEMLSILSGLDLIRYSPRHYVLASSDETSPRRLVDMGLADVGVTFEKVPRAREVGQSYFFSLFSTLYAFVYSTILLLRIRPRILICNGPGTCVPICLAAVIIRNVTLFYIQIVYIESICRVRTLSLSGKILYPLANQFLVQWQDLTIDYPKAKYVGRVM